MHPLKQWRKNNNMTQAELAEKADCVRSTIAQIETRDRYPTLQLALRIEAATGGAVTAAELLSHLAPEGYELRLEKVDQGELGERGEKEVRDVA